MSPHSRSTSGALETDLYEVRMLQAYHAERMHEEAVFSLFVRRLPPSRNYLLACGLDDVLRRLEGFRFEDDDLAYLETVGGFSTEFLCHLGDLRFTGDVWAMPEGTPFFATEPVLEIVAPIGEAQIVETLVMNQMHAQTVLASKAARVVAAARGRRVIDFGMRRTLGFEAARCAARALWIAGGDGTSNLSAGNAYGIPVVGTMAHSYVQAHEDELEAFRSFTDVFPEAVLLVDTYGTAAGVRNVVKLAHEQGERFSVRGVRLDSGDLVELARRARDVLDSAGLTSVEVLASGGLDETRIAALLDASAPIDGFGVGTALGTAMDAPALDLAYKLVSYAGRGRMKLSPGKATLPARKQVFRVEREGTAIRDVVARHDETLPGRPLLRRMMRAGCRTEDGRESLGRARERAGREIALLPEPVRSLGPAKPEYPVEISPGLDRTRREVRERLGRSASA